MRILLVNDYATPKGGAEIQMLGIREGLRERGHDVRLFASAAGGVREGTAADYVCFGTNSRFRTILQSANPWAYFTLRHALQEFRPEVVHVRIFLTQLSPLILPLLGSVPTLYHACWYRSVCPIGTKLLPDNTPCTVPAGAACYRNGCLPLRDWVPLMAQRALFRRWRHVFDRVIALSDAVRDQLIADDIEPVELMGNGVPVMAPRPPLSLPPMVAFAGRLSREKGADVLVRAFRHVVSEIPIARLVMAGDGPERASLVQLVATLGLRSHVTLLGYLTRDELERSVAKAWVQAIPSRWSEPFGNVAAEAMMRGTAVVATASGGLSSLVQDGQTGSLVPTNDVDSLARALVRFLRDRDLAEQTGRRAREFALRHLGVEAYFDRLLELYQALIPKGARSNRGPASSLPR